MVGGGRRFLGLREKEKERRGKGFHLVLRIAGSCLSYSS